VRPIKSEGTGLGARSRMLAQGKGEEHRCIEMLEAISKMQITFKDKAAGRRRRHVQHTIKRSIHGSM
jgi:hypothetical protein